MNEKERPVSIISLTLCAIAITLITSALVVAKLNHESYLAESYRKENVVNVVETKAYVKIYSLGEVRSIARQAFVDNYLSFYDNEVDLEGFEALILGDMLNKIPEQQLYDYVVSVTADGVDVQYK